MTARLWPNSIGEGRARQLGYLVSHEELLRLIDYDPLTGIMAWKVRRKGTRSTQLAGSRSKQHGYFIVVIDKVMYLRHRLAWFYVHGQWPKGKIDHRNGVHGDDWIENLRPATDSQNQQNKIVQSTNLIGVKGVRWDRRARKYIALIGACRTGRTQIGSFDTIEDASAAYLAEAERRYGEFAISRRQAA